jgi:vacuolar-type H+-ATPase subunit C/Vma6
VVGRFRTALRRRFGGFYAFIRRHSLKRAAFNRILNMPVVDNMKTLLSETEIRMMVDGLKTKDPNITGENIQKSIRGNLVLQGLVWSEEMERKIRYCININPI